MKARLSIFIVAFLIILLSSCRQKEIPPDMNIIFLHHSTGGVIWKGKNTSTITKLAGKISVRLANIFGAKAELPTLFKKYNKEHNVNYAINELIFPKLRPYGWNNFPYDYYNIWVKNEGEMPYMEEPTLEMLTKEYQVIILKHCFPVCNIQEDGDTANVDSDVKTISNYKLQYLALRDKLHKFPDSKFILFTGAALINSSVTEDEAKRAREFFTWVTEEWDQKDDNIYLWDFYRLQTEGSLYFREEYAVSTSNPHPNENFASKAVKLLFNRIIDVIENNGSRTQLTGEISK